MPTMVTAVDGNQADPNTGNVNINVPYKVYIGLLTQINQDAPIVEVLQNTLGGAVVWTRENAGRYVATLEGAFVLGKTVCPPFDSAGYMYLPLGFNTLFDYGYTLSPDATLAPNGVAINVASKDFASVDFSTIFENQPRQIYIEIRVYQD